MPDRFVRHCKVAISHFYHKCEISQIADVDTVVCIVLTFGYFTDMIKCRPLHKILEKTDKNGIAQELYFSSIDILLSIIKSFGRGLNRNDFRKGTLFRWRPDRLC